MAAGRIFMPSYMPALDSNGDAVPGAKAHFYENLTTIAQATYTTSGLSTPNANPVVADASGVWPTIWADSANTFSVALTDADGAPLPQASWSGVSASIDATLASADLAEAAQAAAESAQASAEAALTGATALATEFGDLAAAIAAAQAAETGAETAEAAAEAAQAAAEAAAAAAEVFDPTNYVINTRQISAGGMATGGGDLSANRTITVTAAAAADVRTGTNTSKALTAAALSGAAAFITLTYAATVAWDAASGFNARVTLAGNPTIGAPTNFFDGVTYCLELVQDGTGSRTVSWNAIWDFGAVGLPVLQTAAGKRDRVFAIYSAASGKLHAAFSKGA